MAKKPKTSDLDYEQVQRVKAALWQPPGMASAPQPTAATVNATATPAAPPLPGDVGAAVAAAALAPGPTIVAEGDSWFDYPPGLDLLDQLRLRHRYNIVSLAQAGDTVLNMAFGTQVNRDFSRVPPSLNQLVDAVDRNRPRVVLLSGGGNDVAGDEFASFLNHADSGLPALRVEFLKDLVHGEIRRAYEAITKAVWSVDPTIAIVGHGYGYAIPDGRAVLNFPFGFRYIGPWLLPSLARKNITKLADGKALVKAVIDEFNTMLDGLQTGLSGTFRYVDLRTIVRAGDWVNELHVNNETAGRCADKLDAVVRTFFS